MANYTERDLNNVLLDYIADLDKKIEVLQTRNSMAQTPIELALVTNDIVSLLHRAMVACSIIIDLSVDEYTTTLVSKVLDDMRQRYKAISGDLDIL